MRRGFKVTGLRAFTAHVTRAAVEAALAECAAAQDLLGSDSCEHQTDAAWELDRKGPPGG
jgi:hypothetical protein